MIFVYFRKLTLDIQDHHKRRMQILHCIQVIKGGNYVYNIKGSAEGGRVAAHGDWGVQYA
jgi:hypothetical protein